MKYIIEFEDEPYMREDGIDYYTCKSARWYKLGDTIINRLAPYTEPDRKAIEDEVWGFAWEVLQLDLPVFREIFGCDTDKMDYRDYKSKYEAWLKQKDEKETSELEEVVALANKLGVHRLYSLVKEIRGE